MYNGSKPAAEPTGPVAGDLPCRLGAPLPPWLECMALDPKLLLLDEWTGRPRESDEGWCEAEGIPLAIEDVSEEAIELAVDAVPSLLSDL